MLQSTGGLPRTVVGDEALGAALVVVIADALTVGSTGAAGLDAGADGESATTIGSEGGATDSEGEVEGFAAAGARDEDVDMAEVPVRSRKANSMPTTAMPTPTATLFLVRDGKVYYQFDYWDTVGGLIFNKLGHVPTIGEQVDVVSRLHLGLTRVEARARTLELLTQLNKGLAEIKANGTYQKIFDKYFAQ